jgi:hypothetical protein
MHSGRLSTESGAGTSMTMMRQAPGGRIAAMGITGTISIVVPTGTEREPPCASIREAAA